MYEGIPTPWSSGFPRGPYGAPDTPMVVLPVPLDLITFDATYAVTVTTHTAIFGTRDHLQSPSSGSASNGDILLVPTTAQAASAVTGFSRSFSSGGYGEYSAGHGYPIKYEHFSLFAHMKRENDGQTGSTFLTSLRNSSTVGIENAWGTYWRWNHSDGLFFALKTGSIDFGGVKATGDLRDGQWHDFAVTVQRGAEVRYYCDGALIGTSTIAADTTSSPGGVGRNQAFAINAIESGGAFGTISTATLDEVCRFQGAALTDGVLTAQQVAKLHQLRLGGTPIRTYMAF